MEDVHGNAAFLDLCKRADSHAFPLEKYSPFPSGLERSHISPAPWSNPPRSRVPEQVLKPPLRMRWHEPAPDPSARDRSLKPCSRRARPAEQRCRNHGPASVRAAGTLMMRGRGRHAGAAVAVAHGSKACLAHKQGRGSWRARPAGQAPSATSYGSRMTLPVVALPCNAVWAAPASASGKRAPIRASTRPAAAALNTSVERHSRSLALSR